MKTLSRSEKIAVGVALVVTFGMLFLGNYIFNGARASQQSDDQAVQNGNTSETFDSAGLEVSDIVLGTGKEVRSGDAVSVHYVGSFLSGKQFDSSYERGEPLTFKVGSGQLIKGFDRGVVGMQVGGKRKLTIPPELGYGKQVIGEIPANSTIVFEVELVGIEK